MEEKIVWRDSYLGSSPSLLYAAEFWGGLLHSIIVTITDR